MAQDARQSGFTEKVTSLWPRTQRRSQAAGLDRTTIKANAFAQRSQSARSADTPAPHRARLHRRPAAPTPGMSRRQRREQQLRLPLVLPRSSQTRPRLPDDSGSSIITSAVPDLRPPTASVVGASPTAPVVRPPPTAPASGRSLPLPPVPDDEPAPSELERSDAFSLILTLDDVAAGLARPRRARAHRPGPLAVGVLALAVVLWMTAYVQAWTALSMNDRCVNLWDRVVQAITAADFALR